MAEKDTFTRELWCDLGDHEIAERAGELARIYTERDGLIEDRRSKSKAAKEVIDGLTAELRELSETIRLKREKRAVECRQIRDYDAGVVRTLRADTGEELTTRALLDVERQIGLPFEKHDPNGLDWTETVDVDGNFWTAASRAWEEGFTYRIQHVIDAANDTQSYVLCGDTEVTPGDRSECTFLSLENAKAACELGEKEALGRAALEAAATPDVSTCRVCGCTDDDCHACIEKTGEACHWVEADLCSACVDD